MSAIFLGTEIADMVRSYNFHINSGEAIMDVN